MPNPPYSRMNAKQRQGLVHAILKFCQPLLLCCPGSGSGSASSPSGSGIPGSDICCWEVDACPSVLTVSISVACLGTKTFTIPLTDCNSGLIRYIYSSAATVTGSCDGCGLPTNWLFTPEVTFQLACDKTHLPHIFQFTFSWRSTAVAVGTGFGGVNAVLFPALVSCYPFYATYSGTVRCFNSGLIGPNDAVTLCTPCDGQAITISITE